MGFLTSSIQVAARHSRCSAQWKPHLLRTKAAILEAAALAQNRRIAVMFGAGLLHDIPLRELSSMFEEVILADVVHTLRTRWVARGFPNVRLCALDVTGVATQLSNMAHSRGETLPKSEPSAFLEEKRLDLSVSVNLLSQLAWVPGRFLKGILSEDEVARMQKQLLEAHLDYLRRLPGHTALITDVRWRSELRLEAAAGAESAVPQGWDVLQGVSLPRAASAWDWNIAPAPERSAHLDYTATVHAYPDWKHCSTLASPE